MQKTRGPNTLQKTFSIDGHSTLHSTQSQHKEVEDDLPNFLCPEMLKALLWLFLTDAHLFTATTISPAAWWLGFVLMSLLRAVQPNGFTSLQGLENLSVISWWERNNLEPSTGPFSMAAAHQQSRGCSSPLRAQQHDSALLLSLFWYTSHFIPDNGCRPRGRGNQGLHCFGDDFYDLIMILFQFRHAQGTGLLSKD